MHTQAQLNGFMFTAKRLGLQVSSIGGDFSFKAFGWELFRDPYSCWSITRHYGISEHPCGK